MTLRGSCLYSKHPYFFGCSLVWISIYVFSFFFFIFYFLQAFPLFSCFLHTLTLKVWSHGLECMTLASKWPVREGIKVWSLAFFLNVKIVIKYSFLDRLCFFFGRNINRMLNSKNAWKHMTEGYLCLENAQLGNIMLGMLK